MAKNSHIEWTHHTFNPWWGCTRVSAACKNCYAERWAKRVGANVWGARMPRRFFGDRHWNDPLKWNREAEMNGHRRRVFCASMADVFEQRRDLQVWRERLWKLIEETPWLDWLLLTKRPEKVSNLVPWNGTWPSNVWIGTTVESKRWIERRIRALVELPVSIKFLSCEPLLDLIDLQPWMHEIDWVIAGGESGPHSRPMNPIWIRALRDQCTESRVAFHFKQWGNWKPVSSDDDIGNRRTIVLRGNGEVFRMASLGKTNSGRELDGRTWDEIPK